jgi:hypothetical protein
MQLLFTPINLCDSLTTDHDDHNIHFVVNVRWYSIACWKTDQIEVQVRCAE